MSKIFKLFINENIKTWKKFSTKLVIILIILSLIGVLGLVKGMQKIYENSEIEYNTIDWKADAKHQIENIEKSLEQNSYDAETTKNLQEELERFKLAIEYDVNYYYSYWKSEVLDQIILLKSNESDETKTSELIELLKNNDFKGYIERKKASAKTEFENKEISEQEYNDKITILDLQEKYEIEKAFDDSYWRIATLNEIELCQRSIRTGINHENNKVLTVEQKQKYENDIKLNIYRIENNIPPIEYADENYRMIFDAMAPMFITAIIAIFAMIVAGGAISSEVSTGTIKFWALTPNKRWKILTAKILSLLFYIVVITLVASLLTVIFSNIFFDTTGNEYIYVKNGSVQKIGNTLFTIEYYFAKMIPVIIFALFALMLSNITRNTSVAISLSIATYMGNGIAMTIINSYIKKDWVKFIPFSNLNIADKIFSNFKNPMSLFGQSSLTTSLGFSLGVLAVCALLMLVTSYDSFNKRNII